MDNEKSVALTKNYEHLKNQFQIKDDTICKIVGQRQPK